VLSIIFVGSVLSLALIAWGLNFVLRYLGVKQQVWKRSFQLSSLIIGISILAKIILPSLAFLMTVFIVGLLIRKVLIVDYLKAFAIPFVALIINWAVLAGTTFAMLPAFQI